MQNLLVPTVGCHISYLCMIPTTYMERHDSSKKKERHHIKGTIIMELGNGEWFIDFRPLFSLKEFNSMAFTVTHCPAFTLPSPSDYLSPDEDNTGIPKHSPSQKTKKYLPKEVTLLALNNWGLGIPLKQLSLMQMFLE